MDIPRASPKASISQTIGVCGVTLHYGRPSARGRRVMGELVPYGKVWRAGADEATTISFSHPARIEGQQIPAGKYALAMTPDATRWTVILNSEWCQLGVYNLDVEKDVLRVEVPPQSTQHTEMCTYTFTEVTQSAGTLNLEWERTRISLSIETDTHAHTLEEITRAVSAATAHWFTYSAAAQYHFYERHEADIALEYIDAAIALHAPNPAPWMLKSQILASQGDYEQAIRFATEAIEVSRRHDFLFEVEENEANIQKWS